MTTWLVVLAASLATYGIRVSMVVLFHQRSLPRRLESMLGVATPAVLASISAAALLAPAGSISVPPLGVAIAFAAAAAAVWRSGKPVFALVIGLPLALAAAAAGWA